MKQAIVVGTGAGGVTVARELVGRFDVTILEAGGEFQPFAGRLGTYERLRSTRLLMDPRMISLLFPSMRVTMTADEMALVRAICTGGTTTLATGNAVRCDQHLRQIGIDLDTEFRVLAQDLPISVAHRERWRPITQELFSACERLGLEPAVTPKLVDYSRCCRCGRCVLGCPVGAKWDARQFLTAATEQGARLLTGAVVERVIMEGPSPRQVRATGVVVRSRGRRRILKADLVVLAAGGLGTAALLSRSAISTEERLFVDPVLCVAARLDGCLADCEVPMPFYLEGDGYIVSPYFDHLSFFFNHAWRRSRHDIVSLMIKLADSENGRVDSRHVHKSLSERDRQRLRTGVDSCLEILGACGIDRRTAFLGTLNAGHPGGTLPLTGRERRPLQPDCLPDNVYVADASLLPRALGKPPILTIMALARRVAAVCGERFA